MRKPYAGLTVFSLTIALASSMFLGQTKRPYDIVAIKFCPKTANTYPKFGKEFSQRAQQKLDKEYCRYERKLLKEVWEQKQFESSTPIPESALRIRNIPATESKAIWFLVAPIASGLAYLSWAQKSELNEKLAHDELEAYKTCIKINTVSAQNEREFKKLQTNSNWDKQKIKHGFIPVEAIKDRAQRQQEIQDKTHASALKQLELGDSEMDKKIAENLRDKHKADKESQKVLGIKNAEGHITNEESRNQQLVNQLVDALKHHESGWLWTVVDAIKPIWLVGDMGTGKTNTSVAIGLTRKYCLDIPVFRIADRHLNGENSDVWNLLEAQLKANNDLAILEAIQDVIERRDDRINSKVEEPEQFLLDEFTQLAKIDKESVERFVSSTFSDTRKAKEYFIGVTHNLTNAAFGDGTADMRKGAFYLQKFTLDNKKPLPRILIKTGLKDNLGNNLEDVEKTLPTWFRAETIYGHFNNKPIQFEA
ncbi:hypothetical protein NIES4071_108470 (plasmid) [Calothrix sp. NIES-4071]|nr:hypothetical protein NIES4071_108470 [Calothrix sp. NIES-4071]BAZ65141.1 hypothetical protein NIES4105_108740 [Calothrix sp. NIES-4105]